MICLKAANAVELNKNFGAKMELSVVGVVVRGVGVIICA